MNNLIYYFYLLILLFPCFLAISSCWTVLFSVKPISGWRCYVINLAHARQGGRAHVKLASLYSRQFIIKSVMDLLRITTISSPLSFKETDLLAQHFDVMEEKGKKM